MAAKKSKGTITLSEFKAWLEGVSDMQPSTWSPSKEQWEKIKSQIDRIEEETIQVNNEQHFLPIPQNLNNHQLPIPQSGFGGVPISHHVTYDGRDTAGVPIDLNNPPPIGTEFV